MKYWKWLLVAAVLVSVSAETAEARMWGRWRNSSAGYSSNYGAAPVNSSTATAQGVANIMARTGRVGHWGGNRGYEGCGSGGSAAAAYNNCCFARSGMKTVDVGYAQGSNGQWYCCRRYGG